MDVTPGLDVLRGGVAVHAHRPREPGSVHLPVEAQEERVAPVLRRRRPGRDVGIPLARDDRRQGEARLVHLERQGIGSPAEERDRAGTANVVHRDRVEGVERAGIRGAVLPRRGEVDERRALADLPLEGGERARIPRSLAARQLTSDPRAPVHRLLHGAVRRARLDRRARSACRRVRRAGCAFRVRRRGLREAGPERRQEDERQHGDEEGPNPETTRCLHASPVGRWRRGRHASLRMGGRPCRGHGLRFGWNRV